MNRLHFSSSLPRSGSTLLLNLLGQNPNHHVTPTSGVVEIFASVQRDWKKYIEFKSQGLEKIRPRVAGAMKGILLGFYENELLDGKVVFDKSRGWLQYIEDLEQVLGRQVRVICCVRDVRDILASFEKIYRRRNVDWDYPVGDAFLKCQTLEGRCEHLLGQGGVVGLTINRLRDALNRDIKNRLIIISYSTFTAMPVQTVNSLHKVLNLPSFDYNTNDVKQVTYEDDAWHGMDLHNIKSEIITQGPTWQDILPEKYAAGIAKRYEDINKLALCTNI